MQPIKIEIELIVEGDGVTTARSSDWHVRVGDRVAKFMCWDEMFGLVAMLTMPEEKRSMAWLRTQEQWDDLERQHQQRIANRDAERLAEEENPVP